MSQQSSGPPPLKRMIVPALFVGALFLVVFLRQPGGPEPAEQWVLTGRTMGTVFTVKVVVPPDLGISQNAVETVVRDAVDGVDFTMSTYRDDSELSLFNRHGMEPFNVSDSVIEVVSEAQRVAELSGGAFDITVGPLVDAWGFGPDPVTERPDDETIEVLLADNGYRHLVVDRDGHTLRKKRKGIGCDLSAIAKGYAVDRVALGLKDLGVINSMVEVGGEVKVAGMNAAGEAWRIGIERPATERGGLWSAVTLVDAAMATSGDYRNFYERDGFRISHTIDPRTGRPITHALVSVTVIHPSCMTADALATALNVLGPDEGRALVEREGLAALFLVRGVDEEFVEWASDPWRGLNENTAAVISVGRDESR